MDCRVGPFFYTFVPVFIGNLKKNWYFLGSAPKCECAIEFGKSSPSYRLNARGPIGIAWYSVPFSQGSKFLNIA